jgi:hypothetical protein
MKTLPINIFENTADVESGPDFLYKNGDLIIEYIDYRLNKIRYKITEVVFFMVVPSSVVSHSGLCDTDEYEVVDCEMINQYKERNEIGKNEMARHYIIGFNENGGLYIDFIFTGTILKIPQSAKKEDH